MAYRESVSHAPLVVSAFGTNVIATELATGKRVWEREATSTRLLRLEIDGDRVFVLGASLACLDYASGRTIWEVAVPAACTAGTLLVVDESVVIADSGEVACFDAATGALRWHDAFRGKGVGIVALAVPGRAAQADRSG